MPCTLAAALAAGQRAETAGRWISYLFAPRWRAAAKTRKIRPFSSGKPAASFARPEWVSNVFGAQSVTK